MERPPNDFLSSLAKGDFELLRPHLREEKFERGTVLFDQGAIIQSLYFPITGVISFVVPLAEGDGIEAGMVGRDGVAGSTAALDGPRSLNRAIAQVSGKGYAMDIASAKAAVTASRPLRVKLYQQDQLFMLQAQQSAACNASHEIGSRFCRWILRTHDLVGGDAIALTQEFIAQMLGVRRTSVTLAAQDLQAAGLITYRRGHIQIRDLEGVKEASCECYEAVKAQRARLHSASS